LLLKLRFQITVGAVIIQSLYGLDIRGLAFYIFGTSRRRSLGPPQPPVPWLLEAYIWPFTLRRLM